jgi:hypothetical protein
MRRHIRELLILAVIAACVLVAAVLLDGGEAPPRDSAPECVNVAPFGEEPLLVCEERPHDTPIYDPQRPSSP